MHMHTTSVHVYTHACICWLLPSSITMFIVPLMQFLQALRATTDKCLWLLYEAWQNCEGDDGWWYVLNSLVVSTSSANPAWNWSNHLDVECLHYLEHSHNALCLTHCRTSYSIGCTIQMSNEIQFTTLLPLYPPPTHTHMHTLHMHSDTMSRCGVYSVHSLITLSVAIMKFYL